MMDEDEEEDDENADKIINDMELKMN